MKLIDFISAVNGLMYGNLPGLEMCAGDKVRWYTFGLGTEADIHGVYFEGNTFEKQSTTRDTLSLFPHTTATVGMQPNTPGTPSQTRTAATQKPHPPPLTCINRVHPYFSFCLFFTNMLR